MAERPSPEEMLARAAHEAERAHSGRLKLFFGAAPGVGKTYAMLEQARVKRAQNVDVVIGWVETHGRADTAALTAGIESVPARTVAYRGVTLQDFDLDAALARRPGLLLLDELAHTNAPGARHTRRWQDVVELLDSGIDVWTTLNVQHVESLNDVVNRATGVVVRETVPDALIDRADEIELVDLPPDDLLKRLREGKVYLPAQAERAGAHFFKKGNLIALRELALRRTAERVDLDAAEWEREQGENTAHRANERVLVAIEASPQSGDLVRAGRRMAAALRAPWIVATVEGALFGEMPAEPRERLSAHLALAQRLGAQTLVLRGDDTAGALLDAAADQGVSRIVVGRPRRPWWRRVLRRSVVDELVRRAGDVDVVVTALPEHGVERPRESPGERRLRARRREWLFALVPVFACTVLCHFTRGVFSLADQAMIYLLGVLVASSALSRGPSLLAAVASILALNYFFVEPYFTFAVADTRYVVTFLVMLAVAVAVSRRTVLLREQTDEARERERRTSALFALGRDVAAADEPVPVAEAAVAHVASLLRCDAAVFGVARDGALEKLAGDPRDRLGSERELAVARWVHENGLPAGVGTDTLPASGALYLPLEGERGPLGVLGVLLRERGEPLSPSERQVLETFVAQTGLALERVDLRAQAARARSSAEAERTRSALLGAVSHDLRTPLASMTGAAQVLLDQQATLSPADRDALLESVRDEGERLGRLVGNLLDLTRIESGGQEPKREWVPVEELVESALLRIEKALAGHDVKKTTPKDVFVVPVDPLLVEQVLVNLLENAAKYSAPGTPIEIDVQREGDEARFEVRDRGRGIPSGEAERIFDSFHRAQSSEGVAGSGLGLALARAVVRAHGGAIWARNRDGGGAVFAFTLPCTHAQLGAPPLGATA